MFRHATGLHSRKPRGTATAIAAAAPDLPFYYYDIPALTGVSLPIDRFLVAAAPRIPNLVGEVHERGQGSRLQANADRQHPA